MPNSIGRNLKGTTSICLPTRAVCSEKKKQTFIKIACSVLLTFWPYYRDMAFSWRVNPPPDTYHLVTHNDRTFIPAAFKTHGKIQSVKLDDLRVPCHWIVLSDRAITLIIWSCLSAVLWTSRSTWCLFIQSDSGGLLVPVSRILYTYLNTFTIQYSKWMSDTSIRLRLRAQNLWFSKLECLQCYTISTL